MTLPILLPSRVEKRLAENCVEPSVAMTEAVKLAPEKLLGVPVKPVSRELGADLFGVSAAGRRNEIDLARHSKRLLRERFRGGA